MLKRLKERFLGDERTVGALAEIKSLYDTADDPGAFHLALTEGDIERAADHHPLSAEELHDRFGDLMEMSEELADEYSEIETGDREEFINA